MTLQRIAFLRVTHSETLIEFEIKDFNYETTTLTKYKHKKGGIYTKYTELDLNSERLVIYRSDKDGKFWARPVEMFNAIDEEEGKAIPKFKRI